MGIELGRTKNVNKNPVSDKVIRELEEEIVRSHPPGGRLSPRELSVVTARLGTRIRSRGLSSREMWFQRDQFTNDQLPMIDINLINDQFMERTRNHRHSERSKSSGEGLRASANVNAGDIVYLYADGNKHNS